MRKTIRGAHDPVFMPDLEAYGQQLPLQPFGRSPATEIGPRHPTVIDGAQRGPVIGGDFTIQAVTGTFSNGVLTVNGDALSNNVTVSRNAAGVILVNGGAVATIGGTPTIANTAAIQVFGQTGNDVITLSETSGALPRGLLFGGAGNDTLTGGSGADQLFGQNDDDTLLGRGGNDFLFGGAGNDVLTGGDGDDQVFGDSGDDRMIWNPGDDDEIMEGGAGFDTAEINAGGGAEVFTIVADDTRVRVDRVEPAAFFIDMGTTERLVLNASGGDDHISASGNLAALIQLTIDGGAGNDAILGSNGADTLLGGDGNDFIDGQQGDDSISLGAGDDVFRWDAGDGSDTVEGQSGKDTMQFNGSAANEAFDAAADGGRLRVARSLGNVVLDTNDLEVLQINALGGTDQVRIGDLSATDVREVSINLAVALGGTAGDGLADTVTVTGTNGSNNIDVIGNGASVSVTGLAAAVNITGSEGANDALVVNALGGNDTITATALPPGFIRLTLDGGTGNDRIFGSQAADTLLGGDGNDFILGDGGNDFAFMGAGDDVFQWEPGDGNDMVEGQDGNDTVLFNGANVAESFEIAANDGRTRLFRNVANITMDMNDVETIELKALGGTDSIVIGDLGGTDVTQIKLDLTGSSGTGGDGVQDSVTVSGSRNGDLVTIADATGGVRVSGLSATVLVTGADASDRLVVNGLDGVDIMDASALSSGRMAVTLNGGAGNDVLVGSQGNDVLIGGDGTDRALMGAGDDTFVWNSGDDNDTVEGQAGVDTLLVNGANVAESMEIAANGERVRFFGAGTVVDANDVERIEIKARGGSDNILINDLSSSDVTLVDIDLASASGTGDAQLDSITAQGTSGDDVISVAGSATELQVFGLAARIDVTGAEASSDRIVINALAGNDLIDASGVAAGSMRLVLNGGAGDDVLLGGAGDDILMGGDGDDVLIGGEGNDVLDGGAGDDVIIGGPGDDIEINGFLAGAGTNDRVDVSSFDVDFDWLMAHATELDGGVMLDLGSQHITLRGVSLSQLHQDDFLLG